MSIDLDEVKDIETEIQRLSYLMEINPDDGDTDALLEIVLRNRAEMLDVVARVLTLVVASAK